MNSLSKLLPGKKFLLTASALFCLTANLVAEGKPTAKYHGAVSTELNRKKDCRRVNTTDKIHHAPFLAASGSVGLPAVSYAGPQIYAAGTAITPLSPGGGGAAAPSYSSSTTTLGSGFNIPAGIAVDSKGNIFIGDQNNNQVKEIPVGSNTPIVIASGFSTPDGVAVDAQDNVYVANDGGNNIQEIPLVGGKYGAPIVLGGAFAFLQPFDVA